jgi:hypothetical protein
MLIHYCDILQAQHVTVDFIETMQKETVEKMCMSMIICNGQIHPSFVEYTDTAHNEYFICGVMLSVAQTTQYWLTG